MQEFGGPWTVKKLKMLQGYLDLFTSALKNNFEELVYIDAFAGTSRIAINGLDTTEAEAAKGFIEGSAEIATRIVGKAFDRIVLIEKDAAKAAELQERYKRERNARHEIIENDANEAIPAWIDRNRHKPRMRGVLFADPFGTQLHYKTVEVIAQYEQLDTWILCPVGALARMLPLEKRPEMVNENWARRLNRTYGSELWKELYKENPQQGLFDEVTGEQREQGVAGLLRIYKEKLRMTYTERLLERSCTLKTESNVPLYELLFCTGSSSTDAIKLSHKLAKYMITRAGNSGDEEQEPGNNPGCF